MRVEPVGQGIEQHANQRAGEEQQITQLLHGIGRRALGRRHALAHEQRHQGQRPSGTSRRRTDGEFGGDDDAECTTLAQLAPPEQQAQAQRIQIPADQHHAEHGGQQATRKVAQSFEQAGAAKQKRHHGRREQGTAQQPPAPVHATALVWRYWRSQSILVSGVLPSCSSRSSTSSQ